MPVWTAPASFGSDVQPTARFGCRPHLQEADLLTLKGGADEYVRQTWRAAASLLQAVVAALADARCLEALSKPPAPGVAAVMAGLLGLLKDAVRPAMRLTRQWVKECQRPGGGAPSASLACVP